MARAGKVLAKASVVLDLYQGRFEGRLLHPGELVICADEKPSIQARSRIHPGLAPAPGHGQRIEHTYERRGALCYLGAWDVTRAKLFGRSEQSGGIEPFDRLVHQVMVKEPYASAKRVLWIVDNGSSHRGQKAVDRLEGRWANLRLVHLPVHASWLNQIEIVQRKLLQPNDFDSTAQLARSLNEFERHYNELAEPFDWNFTSSDLADLLARLAAYEPTLSLAA